jgi:hypothetical protein
VAVELGQRRGLPLVNRNDDYASLAREIRLATSPGAYRAGCLVLLQEFVKHGLSYMRLEVLEHTTSFMNSPFGV